MALRRYTATSRVRYPSICSSRSCPWPPRHKRKYNRRAYGPESASSALYLFQAPIFAHGSTTWPYPVTPYADKHTHLSIYPQASKIKRGWAGLVSSTIKRARSHAPISCLDSRSKVAYGIEHVLFYAPVPSSS
ncbi:hypothetical protein SERLADRAFT_441620 [Serpula lacrymans var. lacrymans S7.9]|uniref:Uncharacterized protein n=1 Tax=Serpula lacrymans var. lacrymans (strain S7.9) TaxID=578457 RepID=F8P741_SERL9|nr:uncharacterized protein SERLADRAFT_441620 [Serpula lacrymans var. lacrymans S7.9]EGO21257.1 hypothetical protein SERLADRAFT_441620 [Serpula lacrymans var. lacrymans S7.9]